jgi:hypothetical protein
MLNKRATRSCLNRRQPAISRPPCVHLVEWRSIPISFAQRKMAAALDRHDHTRRDGGVARWILRLRHLVAHAVKQV